MSLDAVSAGMSRARGVGAVTVQDIVFPADPKKPVTSLDPAALAAKIAAQPGTRRYFSRSFTQVGVAGLAGATRVLAYHGDSSWGAYQMVSGTWFSGPGQAVVSSGFLDATGTRLGNIVTLTDGGRTAPVRLVGEAFSLEDGGMTILTDAASLTPLNIAMPPDAYEFDIDLAPNVDVHDYQSELNGALPDGMVSLLTMDRLNPALLAMDTLAAMLTVLLVLVAGLGVLNTVVLDTRERVHDFGIYKALGMSPKQTVAMVLTSVAGIGLVAGAIGVPIGIAVHHAVLPVMGHAAGTRIPAADLAVFDLATVVPLLLGGLVISLAGALLPAGWAARTRTAAALRTE